MSFTRVIHILKASEELYQAYIALALKIGREDIYKFISVSVRKYGLMTIYTIKIKTPRDSLRTMCIPSTRSSSCPMINLLLLERRVKGLFHMLLDPPS